MRLDFASHGLKEQEWQVGITVLCSGLPFATAQLGISWMQRLKSPMRNLLVQLSLGL